MPVNVSKILYCKMSLIFSLFHYFYSSNSLFAIPANQEFVFVQTKLDPLRDRVSHMVNSLVDFCKDPNSEYNRSNEQIVNTFSTINLEGNGKLCWKLDINSFLRAFAKL